MNTFSYNEKGFQANGQKLRVKGKTFVVREYDFIEGFWVPFIYFKKSSLNSPSLLQGE